VIRLRSQPWRCAQIAEAVVSIKRSLAEAKERALLYNSREDIFKWKPTLYPQIDVLQKSFIPCVLFAP
jgi:hypothetical protein